jgi:hypothetical protein
MPPAFVADTGIDWPAWVQAVGSVVAIVVSVILGFWLQDRDRAKKDAHELQNQITALIAISERCVKNLERLDERARKQTFKADGLGWLMDEAEATERVAAAVDLMTLRSPDLTKEVAELQEATRTGRRRLGYATPAIKCGKLPDQDFVEPLAKARGALVKIKGLSKQKTA